MPALTPEQIREKLVARFGEAIGELAPAKIDPFITVKPASIVEIGRFLHDEPSLAFDFLQDETATDHLKEKKIKIVYHLWSYTHRHMIILKCELDRDAAEIDSVYEVWHAADWLEREVYDLFGVSYRKHPDLRRIMLPEDWEGHPLRKDYQEHGGYHGISNVRENPLDLYLAMDKVAKAARAAAAAPPTPPAPAPAAPPPTEAKS